MSLNCDHPKGLDSQHYKLINRKFPEMKTSRERMNTSKWKLQNSSLVRRAHTCSCTKYRQLVVLDRYRASAVDLLAMILVQWMRHVLQSRPDLINCDVRESLPASHDPRNHYTECNTTKQGDTLPFFTA
jgi:hypothetical protein